MRVVANFLVIESWAVSDGLLAETAAHAALEDYRVNMNRAMSTKFGCNTVTL
jgi:hypothetical protein